jgi:TetR/AcrR family transcriptional regulator, repressor for uid operon
MHMDHTPSPSPAETEAAPDRRTRILDAAERCFARAGFHRTTMQDVAVEAGMSPGNLYRYFASKDAMVAGLTERDRARVVEDFTRLSTGEDFLERFASLARKHFEDEPRERAVLCLEIWAEASRNPTFTAISDEFDCEVCRRMVALFQQAQERGLIAPDVDLNALASLMITLANGLFVRRAISPRYDPEREIGAVMAVVEAAFAGRVELPAWTGPLPGQGSGA